MTFRAAVRVLALNLLVAAPAHAGDESTLVYRLITERLALMRDVAAHKWHNGLPIEDLPREEVVLERAERGALALGLDPASARTLFEAQIAAAREVQAYWFAEWTADPSRVPDSPPDLSRATRPRLTALGTEILAAARACVCNRGDAVDRFEQVPGLSGAGAAAIRDALAGLRRFASRLEQVRATGLLRVGTTGDYPPFSNRAAGAAVFTGIDIDLAADLAAALGVTAVFVPTGWPRLVDDLTAGAYDIAMSGVSRTLERQRSGFFTRAYHVGGKTPITRCEAAERFRSLADIDVPGVRLIVNPGGTNEAFVVAHVRRAEIVRHPDNTTIFTEILAGRADVMITDRIEVELQSRRHPGLCGSMSGNLNYQEKAYLLPPDVVWKEFVDTWLSLRLADGTVAAAFRAHGVSGDNGSGSGER